MANTSTSDWEEQSDENISVRPLPSFTITEEAESDMGDLSENTCNTALPFSHYKGSLENINDMSTTEAEAPPEHTDNTAKTNHGVLKSSGTKLEPHVDHGSRKVSFHSDVGSHPNSRRVSAHAEDGVRHDGSVYMQPMQYLHPAYGGIPFAPNFRKISSRKTSMEAFYCPQQMMPRYSQHGKVSVFSIGNASDTGYIEGEETESIPQLGHYRISVFDNQRPTLYQLRQEDEVGSHMIPLFAI